MNNAAKQMLDMPGIKEIIEAEAKRESEINTRYEEACKVMADIEKDTGLDRNPNRFSDVQLFA